MAKPDIFSSDQGSQFTSPRFIGRLEGEGIRISMDGRGRALDNIFVERLWRSVKLERRLLSRTKMQSTLNSPQTGFDLGVHFRVHIYIMEGEVLWAI